MIRRLIRLIELLALGGSFAFAQTTQTYTGTIKDLTGAVVTSGQINFTLTPSTDSTTSGTSRFVSTTVSCGINASGHPVSAVDGVSPCTVQSNLALSPTGTSYQICIQPNFSTPGSCFYDYALGGSKDISTIAPTLATGPLNYGGIPGPPGCIVGSTCTGAMLLTPPGAQAVDIPSGTTLSFNSPASTSLSFASPMVSYNIYDNSPHLDITGCGGLSPSGVGGVAPMVQLCGHFSGNDNPTTIYTDGRYTHGFTGFAAGISLNAIADRGSLPQQVFQNMLLADNSGWDIVSCSRAANIGTCILNITNAPNLLTVGSTFYISGNSSFNTGAFIDVATAVSSNTVTWSSPGANAGPVSGGVLAPNHTNWALEVNAFNNNHDPTVPTPISGQNNEPFHGITATGCCGAFPLSEAFFANGLYYNGFMSETALNAHYVAGYPTVGGVQTGSQVGFDNRPYNVATAGANYPSNMSRWTASVWNGVSYNELSNMMALVPVSSTATNSDVSLNIVDSGGNTFLSFLHQQFLGGSGSATTPTFSAPGNPTTGFYVDPGGVAQITVNGTNRFSISSLLVASTLPLTVPALTATASVSSGAGMQHIRGAVGCSTTATMGATCTSSPITFAVPFADTSYTLTCSLDAPTGVPVVSSVSKSAASFTITIASLTTAAATGNFNCIGMHD